MFILSEPERTLYGQRFHGVCARGEYKNLKSSYRSSQFLLRRWLKREVQKMSKKDAQSEAFLNSDAVGDEFFIDIVEKKLNIARDDFKLKLVLLSPATGKNENYVSVLYRAKIKIENLITKTNESVDVIVKVLLTTIPELKAFSVFPRERLVYEAVLSNFEKIWADAGEEVSLGPKSIKFETDPYEIIVLDDLKAANFVMLDRKVGLNMAQTKMLLAKLAKFHAASAIRYQTVSNAD